MAAHALAEVFEHQISFSHMVGTGIAHTIVVSIN